MVIAEAAAELLAICVALALVTDDTIDEPTTDDEAFDAERDVAALDEPSDDDDDLGDDDEAAEDDAALTRLELLELPTLALEDDADLLDAAAALLDAATWLLLALAVLLLVADCVETVLDFCVLFEIVSALRARPKQLAMLKKMSMLL